METGPTPEDTQEKNEHYAAKPVSTASNVSISHPNKYAKSHDKFQTKVTTPKFTSENTFLILQAEHDARTPTLVIPTTREKKMTFPQLL
jgi:hypothetical protein